MLQFLQNIRHFIPLAIAVSLSLVTFFMKERQANDDCVLVQLVLFRFKMIHFQIILICLPV